MDDFWRLVILSLSMFIGCYVSGSIPLILTLSEVNYLLCTCLQTLSTVIKLYHAATKHNLILKQQQSTLLFSDTQSVLRKVTTFGAGLLIGTALIVIIPEGMESLFGEGRV